jgi:hypothetical protein
MGAIVIAPSGAYEAPSGYCFAGCKALVWGCIPKIAERTSLDSSQANEAAEVGFWSVHGLER